LEITGIIKYNWRRYFLVKITLTIRYVSKVKEPVLLKIVEAFQDIMNF
jgi:hypothetical protein